MVKRTLSIVVIAAAALAITVFQGQSTARLQGGATPSPEAAVAAEGMVVVESPLSVAATMDRLEATVTELGLIVVARIDHAANAAGVGQELRPTQLLIFGNPELGTQLMQAGQTIGIDLPQKILVWEAEDGRVYLGYSDPAYLAARHGITDQEEVLGQVTTALANLAMAATAP